jgi:hypothetical protein
VRELTVDYGDLVDHAVERRLEFSHVVPCMGLTSFLLKLLCATAAHTAAAVRILSSSISAVELSMDAEGVSATLSFRSGCTFIEAGPARWVSRGV